MKIVYLKNRKELRGTYFVKITKDNVLTVTDDKIEVEILNDDTIEKETAWYKETENFRLIDATKQEFDEAITKIASYINEVSKI